MPEFRVKWEIDIDADTPEKAAKQALEHMRNPASIATVFDVIDEHGNTTVVDLEQEDGECESP